jgi:hypothetical protein
MTEVIVNKDTKGVLVFAKARPQYSYISDWILLIKNVVNGDIIRHVSYSMDNRASRFIGRPANWGSISKYRFYTPTKQQRDIIKNFMLKRGYKFNKKNNKLEPIR